MNMRTDTHAIAGWAPPYPTVEDVCESFTERMHSLYLLSFLLIADRAQAERCMVAVMGDGVEAVGNFLEWTSLSARTAILRYAIGLIRPLPSGTACESTAGLQQPLSSDRIRPFAAISSLASFERFVFVMSVLEGLPDEICATLLGCTKRDVVIARQLAQQLLTAADVELGQTQESFYPFSMSSVQGHHRDSC